MLQAREEGLTGPAILLLILGLGVVAWISARAKASRLQAGGTARLHRRPTYHGWYVTLWSILPACLFLIIWSNVTSGFFTHAVPENPATPQLPSVTFARRPIPSASSNLAKNP